MIDFQINQYINIVIGWLSTCKLILICGIFIIGVKNKNNYQFLGFLKWFKYGYGVEI